MTFTPFAPSPGVLHNYGQNLTAFEFTTNHSDPSPNVVIFLGGLLDGYLNVPYIPKLSQTISDLPGKNWVLIQTLIKSSFTGFGTTCLDTDANDLGQLITYLRSATGGNRKKVVLMGHLTGSQGVLQYLCFKVRKLALSADISGIILQAPVSDLEGISYAFDLTVEQLCVISQEVHDEYIANGNERADDILPEKYRKLAFGAPISAYRFHSLFSKRGNDDFFSSYLTAEDHKRTFGKITRPLLVLYGGEDQYVPPYVDKQKLIELWESCSPPEYWSRLSRVIPGATHEVGEGSAENSADILLATVAEFVKQFD